MILIQFLLLPLVLWPIHSLAQLPSSWTIMNSIEMGIPYIPLCILIGIRMMWMTNQGRWMVVNNQFSPTRDIFSSSFFTSVSVPTYIPLFFKGVVHISPCCANIIYILGSNCYWFHWIRILWMVWYFSYQSNIESRGPFDIHGDYVDWNIVQDTESYYFNANKYDENYYFTNDSCIFHGYHIQAHEHNLLPYWRVQISEREF